MIQRTLTLFCFHLLILNYEYLGNINLTGELDTKQTDYTNYIIIFSVVALIIILIIIIYILWKKKRKPAIPKIDEPVPLPPEKPEVKRRQTDGTSR